MGETLDAAARRRSSLIVPGSILRRYSIAGRRGSSQFKDAASDGDSVCRANKEKEAREVLEAIEGFTSVRIQSVEANPFGSRAVFQQSLLYALAFFLTFTAATLNRIFQQVIGHTYFAVMFLHVLLIPLQGFFNALIYRRSVYIRLKQRHPHMSEWQILYRTWRWTFMGPPKGDRESATDQTEPASSGKVVDTVPIRFPRPARSMTAKTLTMTATGEIISQGGVSPPPPPEQDQDQANRSGNTEVNEDFDVPEIADDVMGGQFGENINGCDVGGGSYASMMADLMVSYGDFPNMLTEESYALPIQAPQAYPEMRSSFSQFE